MYPLLFVSTFDLLHFPFLILILQSFYTHCDFCIHLQHFSILIASAWSFIICHVHTPRSFQLLQSPAQYPSLCLSGSFLYVEVVAQSCVIILLCPHHLLCCVGATNALQFTTPDKH